MKNWVLFEKIQSSCISDKIIENFVSKSLSIKSNISDWQTVVKGDEFDHNLDMVPLEIKSNTPKGTDRKSVSILGTIADPVQTVGVFWLIICMKDYSPWMAHCSADGCGNHLFDPEPETTEVIWTVFKTAKELVFECNGVFCLKYAYSDSTRGDARCSTFKQPSKQISFVDTVGQAAEQYRASGSTLLTSVFIEMMNSALRVT